MRHDAHANWSRWVRWASSALIASLTLFLILKVVDNWRGERWIFAAETVSSGLSVTPPSAEQLSSAIESALSAYESTPGSEGGARHAAVLGSLLWFRITQHAYTQDQLLGEKKGGEETERDISRLEIFLKRAVASDPGDWFARMRLGGVLARIGDESGSRGAFVGAMQRLPLYALTYQEYAASLCDFGSLDEARHYYLVSTHFQDAGSVSRTLKDLEKLLREKSFEASRESGTKSGRAGEESVPVLK